MKGKVALQWEWEWEDENSNVNSGAMATLHQLITVLCVAGNHSG